MYLFVLDCVFLNLMPVYFHSSRTKSAHDFYCPACVEQCHIVLPSYQQIFIVITCSGPLICQHKLSKSWLQHQWSEIRCDGGITLGNCCTASGLAASTDPALRNLETQLTSQRYCKLLLLFSVNCNNTHNFKGNVRVLKNHFLIDVFMSWHRIDVL